MGSPRSMGSLGSAQAVAADYAVVMGVEVVAGHSHRLRVRAAAAAAARLGHRPPPPPAMGLPRPPICFGRHSTACLAIAEHLRCVCAALALAVAVTWVGAAGLCALEGDAELEAGALGSAVRTPSELGRSGGGARQA